MSYFGKDSTVVVDIDGKVVSKPRVLLQCGVVRTFRVIIEVKRMSDKVDTFQLDYASDLGVVLKEGDFIHVTGDIRTMNKEKTDFVIDSYIFAKEITFLDSEPENYTNNCVIKNGGFYKFIEARKSYDSKNVDIAEYIICLGRKHGRVSYFRGISWNHDAVFIGNTHDDFKYVDIKCRLQSYLGKNGDRFFINLAVFRFSTQRGDNND